MRLALGKNSRTHLKKTTKAKRAGGMAKVVEHLLISIASMRS